MAGRFAMVHNEEGCREVAFFYDHALTAGEPLRTEHAIYPSGAKPTKGQPVHCSHCGANLIKDDLLSVYQDEELPRPKTIILVDTMQFNLDFNK